MSEEEYTSHYSVFLNEVLEHIVSEDNKNTDFKFADMTFGGGGHTFALAKKYSSSNVYAVDQDPEAIANGSEKIRLNKLEDKVELIHTNFENFPAWVDKNKPQLKFDGILMDLGVSSHHFDSAERGFSFRSDAPLDMRMNPASGEPSAKDIINEYREEELADIFFKYGEDKLSRKIAKEIVAQRKTAPIGTTKELENIIYYCYPKKMRFSKTHPATRVFQALRIYVNRELEVLENTIVSLYDLLNTNGRLAIISFHSLEDRIVKHKFKEIFQIEENLARIITKRPLIPTEQEIAENSRSRSAKLRIIEKSTMEGMNDSKGKYKSKKKYNQNS